MRILRSFRQRERIIYGRDTWILVTAMTALMLLATVPFAPWTPGLDLLWQIPIVVGFSVLPAVFAIVGSALTLGMRP